MSTQTEVRALLADLVHIDSVNPTLIPGAQGEEAIAAFIMRWARDAGLEASVHNAALLTAASSAKEHSHNVSASLPTHWSCGAGLRLPGATHTVPL